MVVEFSGISQELKNAIDDVPSDDRYLERKFRRRPPYVAIKARRR